MIIIHKQALDAAIRAAKTLDRIAKDVKRGVDALELLTLTNYDRHAQAESRSAPYAAIKVRQDELARRLTQDGAP